MILSRSSLDIQTCSRVSDRTIIYETCSATDFTLRRNHCGSCGPILNQVDRPDTSEGNTA